MYGQEIKLYKTRTKVAHNYNLVSLELLLPTTTTADHDDKLLTPTAKTEGSTVQGENENIPPAAAHLQLGSAPALIFWMK